MHALISKVEHMQWLGIDFGLHVAKCIVTNELGYTYTGLKHIYAESEKGRLYIIFVSNW